jgi:predicted nucleotidyltransferase
MDLKDLLGREVDLVPEGSLLPFARETAEQDKKLIYERAS